MASAASEDGRHSPTWPRPNFSIQRLILLGNSWRQRSSVGNLILGKNVFDTETDSQKFQICKEEQHNTQITVINTPDLLQPDIAPNRLTELVTEIADASAPGPHVFLLVLQPEDFTEQQKIRLQSVLKTFSEQAFHHALLLISTPRAGEGGSMQEKHPHLQDMMRFCQYRCLYCFNLDKEELMTRLEQLMKENNGEHVFFKYNHQPQLLGDPPHKQGQSQCFRIILFGKNEDTKKELLNRISRKKSKGRFPDGIIPQIKFTKNQMEAFKGELSGHKITVVKTSNLFSQPVAAVIQEVKTCVSKCSPGPNVLLLLVKPSDFTELDLQTLRFILSLFGPDVFRHSMVVLGDKRSKNPQKCVEDLISDCENRSYSKDKINCDTFMEEIENVFKRNKGSFISLSIDNELDQNPTRPSLNLVLCGSREPEKTSAVKSILGRAELPAASSPEHCVHHQGEVGGHWVSLVELPTLSGKPLQEVTQQLNRCISLCAPEGVHAFILVLPQGSLTNEDKAELKIIQDTLSFRVLLFMILVTVDSDATAPAVRGDSDLQEFSQKCGGGYLIFNTRNQQHVSDLLESVKKLRAKNEPQSFTKEMFLEGQIDELHKELESMKTGQKITCDEKQNTECLRIVLIGKTGSGKSSSGNTILGRKEYKSEASQISVTRGCEKAKTEVEGRSIVVVDTPGLFDTTMSNECIIDEMMRCVSLLAPGPHVFLLTLSIGRLTDEEKETLKHIQTGFGKDAQRFTIILLTHGDNLEEDGTTVEDFIRDKCDASFKKLISDCGNRYHVFNNREKSEQAKSTQVKELLQKIDNMVKENGGKCYTNEMLEKAEAAIRKEMERILKEKEDEMMRERELLESKHKQEVEQMKQELETQKNETENERRRREQELKEKEEKIKEEQELRKREKEEREADDRKRKDEEEQKLREWEQKRKDLEKKIKTEEESKETIDRKLQEVSKQMEDEKKHLQNEREIWWEKRNKEEERRRQEEEQKIKKLQDEYNEQQEKDRDKRKEEDRIRQEQEETDRQKLKEKHQKQVEQLQRTFEEEARKKAEEFNDFRDKKEAEIVALMTQRMADMETLQKQFEDEKTDMCKNFAATLSEKETSLTDDITKLLSNHEQEMGDIVILLLTQKKKNKGKLRSLKKSHSKQLEELEEDIKSDFKIKEKNELKQLKKEQQLEMDKLACEIKNKEKLKEERAEKILQHEIEINTLKNDLLEKQMKNIKTKTAELKETQEKELADFTQKLLEDNEKMEIERLKELEIKHVQEVKELEESFKAEVCSEEFKELKQELDKQHDNKIKEMKEKLLIPEEASCKVG